MKSKGLLVEIGKVDLMTLHRGKYSKSGNNVSQKCQDYPNHKKMVWQSSTASLVEKKLNKDMKAQIVHTSIKNNVLLALSLVYGR